MSQTSTGSLSRAIRQQLEGLERAGLTHLPRRKSPRADQSPRPLATSPAAPTENFVPKPKLSPVSASPTLAAPFSPISQPVQPEIKLSRDDRTQRLAVLNETVKQCQRCSELASTRKQTVFGVGNAEARIVFIGEAPGADEDAQGEPFVGRAGQLLNKIIEACGMKREDVYICNILKCRPPGNRTPAPDECVNCREYLLGQLGTIDPEYIVCWGTVAAQNLLSMDWTIGKMRKRFYQFGRAKVLCTYHPSYLLRNPAAKKDVWEDMKLLFADMGKTLTP
ncbi:MAG: uracil-DNA glycosylase [Planctomycetales bacterium]|nr:uracil-DNA glycosylase [Planctomycetales bacterium]